MRTYKIHLIRHGWTEANQKGFYIGTTDLPLPIESILELGDLTQRALYPDAEWVFSSPLTRAVQTAEIIYPDSDIVEVENLSEICFGEYEGKSIADAKTDKLFSRFVAGDVDVTPKGAENPKDFILRCINAITTIVNLMMTSKVHTAAVITHMSVVGQILSNLALPKAMPYEWNPPPGFGYTIVADPVIYLREPVFEILEPLPNPYKSRDDYLPEFYE